MEIYELVHLYEGADGSKQIGYFKTQEAARAAVNELIKQVGFSDYPQGFFLLPRSVPTQKTDLDLVYAADVFYDLQAYHGGNYTQFQTCLGLYETKEEAERALERYLSINHAQIPGLERSCAAASYRLNEITSWAGGFSSD